MDKPFELSGILLNCFILFQFLYYWITPNKNSGYEIYTLSVLIIFEFVLVHSSVFMLVFQRKISIIFFIIVYGIFAYQFNKYLPKENKIIITYFIIVFNRMRFAFINTNKKLFDKKLGFSGVAVICYIVAIGIGVIFKNSIPEFGLTSTYLKAINYHNYSNSESNLSENPHLLLAIGSIYYFLLILSEIYNNYLENK